MTTLGEVGQQALRDLSMIIERGSRSGYHLVVVINEEELESLGISPAMFAHKFKCFGTERARNAADSPANLFRALAYNLRIRWSIFA